VSTDQLVLDVRVAAARGAACSSILRPAAARLPALVFLAASTRTHPGVAHVAAGLLLVFASYGLAAVYNDLRDLEIDRSNGRDLPLVTGALSPTDARWIAAGCAAAVVAAQALLRQPLGLAVTVVSVALSAAYSHPLLGVERRGAWAPVLLSTTYVGLPLLLAGPLPTAPRTAAALLAAGAMLLYKDVKDEAGDRAHGKRTPLVRWGVRRMDAVAAWTLVVAVLLAAASAPRWPALLLVGGLCAHRRMVVLGVRAGRPLLAFQALVVGGAVALAAV
jgi:4-hydroxybenzoate polyprenyltransferase